MTIQILTGDALTMLGTLPDASVHCCVTSPPYYGLRDYGMEGQIGLEDTPDAFVGRLVDVFREVRRVLRDDGTCWLNIGDSYAGGGRGGGAEDSKQQTNVGSLLPPKKPPVGTKAKDLKAGCPKGGTVIDPFGGAGTTGLVADRLGRNAILIELNPAYVEIARKRISDDAGMFAEVAA